MKKLFLLLCLTSSLLFAKEKKKPEDTSSLKRVTVDLKNPAYKWGILTTREGGVVKSDDLRIQAKNIQYIRRKEHKRLVHRLEAEGDLLFQYKGQVFSGDELEYDFITKTGVIYGGKTYSAPWYVGGDKIELKSDGSYIVSNVFMTSCENQDSSWDLHAGQAEILKKEFFKASNVHLRFFKFPTFWFPSFKLNMRKFWQTPLIHYNVTFDKWIPRPSVRYRVYSWRDFSLFLRGDYRYKRGFGGAVETEYFPKDTNLTFVTKNYLSSDLVPNDPEKRHRYRAQGLLDTFSKDHNTSFHLSWDKFSDIDMPSDFKSDDFEVNSAKRSEAMFRHSAKDIIYTFYLHPRLNHFETLKQELPSIYTNLRPFNLGWSKFIANNTFRASYLDQVYAHNVRKYLPHTQAVRLQSNHEIYYPIHLSPLTLTPSAGIVGIFYSDSPQSEPIGLVSILYSANLHTQFFKNYTSHRHLLEPYLEFQGQTRPTATLNEHYIFSLQDGWRELQLLRIGLKNLFFSQKSTRAQPSFFVDLYTNAFFHEKESYLFIPRLYLDLDWNLPSIRLSTQNAWNMEKRFLDYTKVKFGWTVNEDVAFNLEFRHRSKYAWRKANWENFVLEFVRTEEELLHSPLSDRRTSFLSSIFFRLTPFWSCQISSHHGWHRKGEPDYNEFKIDLFAMLSTSWKVQLSYQHTQKDNRFSISYSLFKK